MADKTDKSCINGRNRRFLCIINSMAELHWFPFTSGFKRSSGIFFIRRI